MKSKSVPSAVALCSVALAALTGCGPMNSQMGDAKTNATNDTPRQAGFAMNGNDETAQVTRLTYDAATQTASLYVIPRPTGQTHSTPVPKAGSVVPSHPQNTAPWQAAAGQVSGTTPEAGMTQGDPAKPGYVGEQAIDIGSHDGIVNYATANLPGKNVRWVRVVFVDMTQNPEARGTRWSSPSPARGGHRASFMVSVLNITASTPNRNQDHGLFSDTLDTGAAAGFVGRVSLPPGVQMDPSIAPVVGIGGSSGQKAGAVIRVARSKLGTPYIWGHNEDRGQYGFDCSNFTAYVYHHALGYRISALSVVQGQSVGYRVSRSQMQVGDLLIFEYGKHVGIYAGNGQMIDCGGGKGMVSYMTIAPGSYWGNHLTAVKRMF